MGWLWENVVSSRLLGSWIVEGALNLRLTGKDEVKDLKKVTFVADDSVFDRLPGKYKVGDNVFGNGESFNVMMVVAEETKNDLLFIGGDFNNQPFRAYRRVKKIKVEQVADDQLPARAESNATLQFNH